MTEHLTIWQRVKDPISPRKVNPIGLIAIYLVLLAVIARTFTLGMTGGVLLRYLGLEIGYTALLSLVLWKPRLPHGLLYLFFVIQCAVVLWLLSWRPDFDFVAVFFFLLSCQAALFLEGRICWTWIFIFVLLTGGSLIFHRGFLEGLALALTTMAAEIVIPAYLIVNRETEVARTNSQALLKELGDTNLQLKRSADQVENLAAIQERNRLARTLHDSVSQMLFSISLTAQATQALLNKDPPRARTEISRLQVMTAEALKQLRSLISEMRPPGPTP